MGSVVCDPKTGHLIAAFPYQVASRKPQEVISQSSGTFDKFFEDGPFAKFSDYHSHTFQAFERILPLGPSETDLDGLKPGMVEIIVQIRRTRRNGSYWRMTKGGKISIAWGRYRFLIGAFMRMKDTDENGVPLYDEVGLKLN